MTAREAPGDSRVRAWCMVALLCVIATLSYLDRYIVALLADPIIRTMDIDATDIGLLIGLGFGLVYSLFGLPLAHLTDRGHRVRIVGIGVLAWSLSTIGSGFAPDYPLLLLTRSGVAIGEAVLVPAAVSLIGDLFPPERRTLPIALFMATSALMSSGAFALGGLAFHLATLIEPITGIVAWRMTLVLVGAPGVALALLWAGTMREPRRRKQAGAAVEPASLAALLKYLGRHAAHYVPLLAAIGLSALGSYSFISWTSTVLQRSFHASVSEAGYYYGALGMIAAALAALLWPAAYAWRTRRGRPDDGLLLLAAGLGIGHALLGSFLLWHSLAGVAVAIFGATFAYSSAGTLAVLILQAGAPGRMRARIISLYMMVGNIVGLTLGPPLSAWLADHFGTGPDALRVTLGLTGAALALPVALLVLLALPGYRAACADAV